MRRPLPLPLPLLLALAIADPLAAQRPPTIALVHGRILDGEHPRQHLRQAGSNFFCFHRRQRRARRISGLFPERCRRWYSTSGRRRVLDWQRL